MIPRPFSTTPTTTDELERAKRIGIDCRGMQELGYSRSEALTIISDFFKMEHNSPRNWEMSNYNFIGMSLFRTALAGCRTPLHRWRHIITFKELLKILEVDTTDKEALELFNMPEMSAGFKNDITGVLL